MAAPSEKFAFDEDYEWPNLFLEADEMLQVALMMYPYTQLRNLIRNGTLKNLNGLLNTPIAARDVIRAIEENTDALMEKLGNEDTTLCQDALKSLQERYEMTEEGCELVSFSSMLLAYGDENNEKELVYGVAVDKVRKRVTVGFRGSVTQADFMTDACISLKAMENPLKEFDGQDDEIKIHSGFHKYLLGEENGRNKFDEIMKVVVPVLAEYPDFKLYTAGHSLGGALSTLFAFEAATSSTLPIPVPVTCVSVASPKVGSESFRKAFQLLEEQGKLRHLRIANERDPVTLSPPASSKLMLLSLSPVALAVTSTLSSHVQDEVYKHVGLKLKLYSPSDKKAKFKLSYSSGNWKQDFFNPASATTPSYHYGFEYSHRMVGLRDDLENKYLNKLYKDECLKS